jgi:hypothetical protein
VAQYLTTTEPGVAPWYPTTNSHFLTLSLAKNTKPEIEGVIIDANLPSQCRFAA